MIVTLMVKDGDYYIEADRDGAISVYRDWPTAFRANSFYVQAQGPDVAAIIDEGERQYRLCELPDKVALDRITKALTTPKERYSWSGILSHYKFMYKLKAATGKRWYEKGQWVR